MKNRRFLSCRIMKSTTNLSSHAFEGSLITAKYSIILPKGEARLRAFSLSNFFFDSYQPTIVSWADITMSLLVRGRGRGG